MTKGVPNCIYGIYTVMTQEVLSFFQRVFEVDGRVSTLDKELKMKRPKGYATLKVLLFVIALILVVLFFLA